MENRLEDEEDGVCYETGWYAPLLATGEANVLEKRRFQVGQVFPQDGRDWVQISREQALKVAQNPARP